MISVFDNLGGDIESNIFLHLDVPSILSVELVRKSFLHILQSNIFWLHLCIRNGVHLKQKIPVDYTHKYYGDEGYDPFQDKLDDSVINDQMKDNKGYWWRKHFFTYYCAHMHFIAKPENINRLTVGKLENARCSSCKAVQNLLCLSKNCFSHGCGRAHEGHALMHYNQFNHPLAVDSRTLEFWCYKCDRYLDGENEEELRLIRRIQINLYTEELFQHRIFRKGYGEVNCKVCLGPLGINAFHYQCMIENDLRMKKLT